MNLSQEEKIEEGLKKVCNALLDGYIERDFDSVTCVCIECNECPFNGIGGLKRWINEAKKDGGRKE